MRKTSFVAAAVAALALTSFARADDPPAKPAAPAAAKHENKISPEAKAAFEKMEKLGGAAAAKGLKDAVGVVTTEIQKVKVAMKFSIKAGGAVAVESDGEAQRTARGAARGAENVLRLAIGRFRPADGSEYDAGVAKKDGKDVLSLTTFQDGAEQSRTDLTLDADGAAVVSATTTRTMTGRDGQKHEMKSDVVYTWTKSDGARRLDKIETTTERGKSTTTIVYADMGGYSLPASWKTEGAMGVVEMRVTELAVDGKKVEIAAPEAPKTEGKKKSGKKDDDDDDDKDEGGKK